MVIDLHRDALNGQKTVYKLPEGTSAQVMLVLTTGDSGLYHPNWRENVKLGLELQAEMEAEEPGLSRPMLLSSTATEEARGREADSALTVVKTMGTSRPRIASTRSSIRLPTKISPLT